MEKEQTDHFEDILSFSVQEEMGVAGDFSVDEVLKGLRKIRYKYTVALDRTDAKFLAKQEDTLVELL